MAYFIKKFSLMGRDEEKEVFKFLHELAFKQLPAKRSPVRLVRLPVWGDWRDYQRKTVEPFRIAPFHAKTRLLRSESGELIGFRREWTLWKIYVDRLAPPVFAFDTDGFINPSVSKVALIGMDSEEVSKIIQELPKKKREHIVKILESWWGTELDKNSPEAITRKIVESGLMLRPLPRLKDPRILRKINWKSFVDQLTAYKAEKDPRIKLVHKSHLFRGIIPRINPNSLEFTNGGTGKTLFYHTIGECFDKVTPKSFLGFAKSPEEIFPGIIDGMEVPIGIDQIESQGAPQIMRYLFNAMEHGWGYVGSGAVKFKVTTTSIFAILGNPIGDTRNPDKSFALMIRHLSHNPALGRRFGIILYGRDFKRVKELDGGPAVIDEWREAVDFFRAVEEYALPRLKKIISSKQVWNWLFTPIEGYEDSVLDLLDGVENIEVTSFLEEHTKGAQHRLRAAALFVALADNLDKVALNEYNIKEILVEAEELLPSFIDLNLTSIANIAKALGEELKQYAITYYKNSPEYIQCIISAIELWRRNQPKNTTILLKTIPWVGDENTEYKYLSKCIDRLKRIKRSEEKAVELERYFGFKLTKKENGEIEVTLTDPNPITFLNPKGRLEQSVLNFSDFSISQNLQRDASNDEVSSNNEKSVSVTFEKWRKLRNGEKVEENNVSVKAENLRNLRNGENEPKAFCGECIYWTPYKCAIYEDKAFVSQIATYAEKCPYFKPRVEGVRCEA